MLACPLQVNFFSGQIPCSLWGPRGKWKIRTGIEVSSQLFAVNMRLAIVWFATEIHIFAFHIHVNTASTVQHVLSKFKKFRNTVWCTFKKHKLLVVWSNIKIHNTVYTEIISEKLGTLWYLLGNKNVLVLKLHIYFASDWCMWKDNTIWTSTF